MSDTAKITKKRLLPKAGKKPESLERSLRRINKKYGETLARLAK